MDENGKEKKAITQNDITALATILSYYERYLWNFAAPSAKRTKQITEIQFLLVKMHLLPATKITELTRIDVSYIEMALSHFIKQTREKIPESKSRNEVLENCEILHDYFFKALVAAH